MIFPAAPQPRRLLVLAVAVVAMAASGERPLREEDIVRLVLSGRSVEEIVRVVRSSPVAFDTSEEMRQELRIAGVPAEVIRAMVERQETLHPTPASEVDPAPIARLATLAVRLAPDAAAPSVVFFPERVDPRLSLALGLGPGEEDAVSELAVFLACSTADHVPDHWRSQTPLGRDFGAMPRHRMLAFRAGGSPVAQATVPRKIRRAFSPPGRGWLAFELPAEIGADIEEATAHDLVLGIAVRVGERWVAIAIAQRRDVLPAAGRATLAATIEPAARTDGVAVEVAFVEPP